MGSEIKVKSNGLRNELKEIRKSIDKLTNAILMAQTNDRYEKSKTTYYPGDGTADPNGMRWVTNYTTATEETSISGTD